jgi:p-aminobenzoyl-glutamate transporter AbgT
MKVTVSPTKTVAPALLPFTVRFTVGVTVLLVTVWVYGADWLGVKLSSP